MIAVTYTLTPTIQDYLLEIDKFRRSILLAPIPPIMEQKLRWQATCAHILGSLTLSGVPITKSELVHLLLHPTKHPSAWERQAISYKNALEVIRADWTANPKPLLTSHIGVLSLISQPQLARQSVRMLKESEEDLKRLLAYTGSQKDHPLILAGVLYGQLMHTEIGHLTHGILPRLIGTLVLAKYGYDCRGMLALDTQWTASADSHTKALASIETFTNLTAWLEYFTKASHAGYESLYGHIYTHTDHGYADIPITSWNINEREKRILHYLENPTAKMTNKIAQQLFHVSQVTASRDLTHLAALGLLLVHGKGRSVYYTKS